MSAARTRRQAASGRQPLAARVWGSLYRTWWPPEGRNADKAKRRSARRERERARKEIRDAERVDG